jgi:site-specific recombinase XerD
VETKRHYARALVEFTSWSRAHHGGLNRAGVNAWRTVLESKGLSPSAINQKLAAVRKLASEAAANGLVDAETAAQVRGIPGAKQCGNRSGMWLTQAQAQALIEAPTPNTLKGKRDRAALALLIGCGLRRDEAARLEFADVQMREGRWVIVDLHGKHGRIRTIPVPSWVKAAIDRYAAEIPLCGDAMRGRLLRAMNRYDRITGDSLGAHAVWALAVRYGRSIGVDITPHDLRRTCAKLCRRHGGELEQIQLLLGHASIQTTERYLGTKQDLANAPNDRLGLKWRDQHASD